MCKYCKNLKRIKDKEEKEYWDIIKKWKKEEYKAAKLLVRARDMILDCSITPYNGDKFYNEDAALFDDIERYLKRDFVGR